MIRYTLKCSDGHAFESWFASASAYDGLAGAGRVTCPECGDPKVEKALMAPRVSGATTTDESGSLPEHPLTALRRKIEAITDDVGNRFAAEARAMHEGDVPHRSIRGVAAPAEARKLIEDGVPITPLPLLPKSRMN